jgi:ligand-binding sensor domain-containing protein/signal transduction histidine kinase/CheY-like chemotaxis protein/AraC-like DNA-binding protein
VKNTIAYILFSLCSLQVFAQNPGMHFEQIGISDGLSESTVTCILQDKKGFMWFGTKGGLNKYDGYKFTVYKANSKKNNSLSFNDIKAMVEDSDGDIWIATSGGGVNLFNPQKEQFIHYKSIPGTNNCISDDQVKSLYADEEGNIWIGTGYNGLDILNKKTGQFRHFVYDKANQGSISDNNITAIVPDSDGNIWIGTANGGLNLFEKKTNIFRHYYNNSADKNSLSSNQVKFIHEDKAKNLWIGTYGGGLNLLNKATGSFSSVQNGALFAIGKDPIPLVLLSIAEDKKGNLWIGTENKGLKIFNPVTNQIVSLRHSESDINSIANNTISSIFNDKKGNTWVGAVNGGINMFNIDAGKFTHYKNIPGKNSLSNNIIDCIYEDSKNNLWIGTDGGGLNKFNSLTKTFTRYNISPSQKNNGNGDYALTVCEDAEKNIWVGTWGLGISIFNPKTNQFKYFKNIPGNTKSLSNDFALFIYKDSKNNIWVGTYGGGLNLFDPATNSFTRYTHNEKDNNSISSDYILTITEDSKKNLWIGTDGGGLNRFDKKDNRFYKYLHSEIKNSISSNLVNTIWEDPQGLLWIGTNSGLNKLNTTNNTIDIYFEENGLPNNIISSIIGDENGFLWIGTSKGLAKFNPQNNSFQSYTIGDGLQGYEFRTACKTKNGTLYFGGKNGFNEFLPGNIKDIVFDPPIVFTSFQIFNKEISVIPDSTGASPLTTSIAYAKEIKVSYKQSVLTFEFASLNFTEKQKKKYAYKLEGVDNDWKDLENRNNITFLNLGPGSYTLKVRGLNNNGTWSINEASIKLIITPPFWKTWWFRLLMLLTGIGITILIFNRRFASIKKRNEYLSEEVEKRTHELKKTNDFLVESNEKIIQQNEQLEDNNKEINYKTDKILEQQHVIVEQNQELEQTINVLKKTNHNQNRLYSILAHDLKNPVAALTGISELLKTELPRLDTKGITNYVNSIHNSSNSVYNLLVDLLDWAATQTGNFACTPKNINLYELVVKNISLAEQQAAKKQLSFSLSIDSTHTIYADYPMMDTVIRNILSNSIKFSLANGKIVISTREDENKIIITIQDAGIGMTKDEIENIFKIEKQLPSSGNMSETSSHLGLVICREFIAINKGSINVTSSPDKGSSFHIHIPKAAKPISAKFNYLDHLSTSANTVTEETKPLAEKYKKLKGRRLLIVDDNEEIRNYLRLLLSSVFEIFEASNGVEGIKAAISIQPTVIITDKLMPVMDGIEFCSKIKNNSSSSHIPVILLTSQNDAASQLSGYEAGADVYLPKPIHQYILLQVIANLINKQEKLKEKFEQPGEVLLEDMGINKLDKEFLDDVVKFIEKHLHEPELDFKSICRHTNMSRTVLYAKFKALTGQGVHDFIKTIKLKNSLRLLQEGRMNITEIAYEVGFATPSYFSKSFLKQYGIPPKVYVANLKKKLI